MTESISGATEHRASPRGPDLAPVLLHERLVTTRGDLAEPDHQANGSPVHQKGPDAILAGGNPMTAAQAAYLQMLSEDAQEPFDPALSAAEAARRIDELQERAGRGPIRLRPVI